MTLTTKDVEQSDERRDAIRAGLLPLFGRREVIAVKTYTLYRTEHGALDVDAFDLSMTAEDRRALAMAIFAEAFLYYPEIAERMGFARAAAPIVN